MFVEQPFHRDVALDESVLGGLAGWRERPRLIIDESDAELNSCARALALGYNGTSHKNCKGVFKGIANACLLALLRSSLGADRLVMSGEDLANTAPWHCFRIWWWYSRRQQRGAERPSLFARRFRGRCKTKSWSSMAIYTIVRSKVAVAEHCDGELVLDSLRAVGWDLKSM
jgi:hypothetical protein